MFRVDEPVGCGPMPLAVGGGGGGGTFAGAPGDAAVIEEGMNGAAEPLRVFDIAACAPLSPTLGPAL
jgi:hypothetical protein